MSTDPSQTEAVFKRQGDTLVAANRRARLALSVVSGGLDEEDGCLLESVDLDVSATLKGRAAGNLRLMADGQPVRCSREGKRLRGRFSPGVRVGEVRFEVLADGSAALVAGVEVRPGRLDYRTHFRAMQAEIETICRALLYRTPGVARSDGLRP